MIALLPALGWLREVGKSLLALAARYPLHCALAAALAANAWQWRGWTAEQAGRIAERKAYAAAQARALARQAAADRVNLEAQAALNHQVEIAHDQAEQARTIAVRDYLARHPLRLCPSATEGGASRTGAAGLPADPPAVPGSIGSGDLAAITPADLDRLSRGYLRGAECTGYLRALVDGGWAKAGKN